MEKEMVGGVKRWEELEEKGGEDKREKELCSSLTLDCIGKESRDLDGELHSWHMWMTVVLLLHGWCLTLSVVGSSLIIAGSSLVSPVT